MSDNMSEITFDFKPYPKQIRFFSSTKRYIAYGGARGGGKSWAARTKALLLAMDEEKQGIQILFLRRSLKELRENHLYPMQKMLNDLIKLNVVQYKDQTKEFIFPGGSRIVFGYCEAERDALQYQGQAYDVIFIEEATQFTELQFTTLTESNRSSGMMAIQFSPRMYFTCNPGGVGHTWVKRLFIDRDYRNKEKAENYEFIQSLVYDNDYLMQNNPEYVENLENLPEQRRKAMLYGDWDAFEGQYFDEFRRDIHIIDPFIIPDHWRRYVTLDYGLDMLAAYWIALSPENIAYVYKERYQSNLIISEAAKAVLETNNGDNIYQWLAPPDLWNRRQDTGKSAAQLFHENGINLVPSKNDRVQGWYCLKEWLKPIDSRDEQTGEEKKTAAMLITKNCVNLIRTLPQLQHDEKNPNDVANEPHELTHAPDAIRGFAITYARPARIPEKPRKYNFDFEKPKPDSYKDGEIDQSYMRW
jgi:phage terminase large subunit